MSICIISGRFPETEFKSYINHKLYADTYGYSYIHCNWPTNLENGYLNKIAYILSYLEFYEYVIWIDDDAFFFDFEKDIMQFAPKGNSFISFCKSPSHKELKTLFSSGQFIVKSNKLSKSFFQSVINTKLDLVKNWWTNEKGYFTNGDQDIMIYLLSEKEEYKNRMDLYDYKSFNSRCENLFTEDIHRPLVLHFTGRGKTKHKNLLKVQKMLNLHPSLVPNRILKKYNIKTLDNYNLDATKPKIKSILLSFINKLNND